MFTGWPPHGVRATVIAPLVAPVVLWLWNAPTAPDPFNGIGVLFGFGCVMAYAAMLGIGLPAIVMLAYVRGLSFGRIVVLGLVAGIAVAEVVRVAQQGALFPAAVPHWLGGVAGAASGAVWWRLAAARDDPARSS
jgi:hypothetical protein